MQLDCFNEHIEAAKCFNLDLIEHLVEFLGFRETYDQLLALAILSILVEDCGDLIFTSEADHLEENLGQCHGSNNEIVLKLIRDGVYSGEDVKQRV